MADRARLSWSATECAAGRHVLAAVPSEIAHIPPNFSCRHRHGELLGPAAQVGSRRHLALVHSDAVLLFGSRSRDDGDEASGWDLFVVLPGDAPLGIARPSLLRRVVPAHDLVVSREDTDQNLPDPMLPSVIFLVQLILTAGGFER